jgi:Rps23 Pro-64 3,4-dihydroxylase Tpa1-like proline 4-hydroxylase
LKWVQIILKSLPDAQQSSSLATNPGPALAEAEAKAAQVEPKKPQSKMYMEFEIKAILRDLKDNQKNELAIQKLDKFSKANPDYDFQPKLKEVSDEFAKKVLFQLEQFRNGKSW